MKASQVLRNQIDKIEDGKITLTEDFYFGLVCVVEDLEKDSDKLSALQAAGVDNWEGYGFAMRSFYKDEDNED